MTDATIPHESNPPAKRKRSLPGTPDPGAEVIALSPKTLMATNRFLCEICGKGFQRDQNLQLHRRGHNLPWKLKQRGTDARKRVYVCPETTCVHHHASRALGDLTGIKKHFCRKHGEKKWKCDKCSKRYAVQSDWKAHSKTCGTKEYKCDCGAVFSRRDSFITHRAFCDALAQETARVTASQHMNNIHYHFLGASLGMGQHFPSFFKPISSQAQNIDPIPVERGIGPLSFANAPIPKNVQQMQSTAFGNPSHDHQYFTNASLQNPDYHFNWDFSNKFSPNGIDHSVPSMFSIQNPSDHQSDSATSATALLQKAVQMGAKTTVGPSLIFDNGLVQDHGNKVQCELYSTSSVTSGHGSDVESSVNDHSALNQLQLYSSNCKRRRLQYEEIFEGETRDFLGVGISPICHPSSINGWI